MDNVLIAMAVWDTEENNRSDYTWKSLNSLLKTVDFNKHNLFISDNGSCAKTQQVYNHFVKDWIDKYGHCANLIINPNNENLGTAKAINIAFKARQSGQSCIKIDNDIVLNQSYWVEEMTETVKRMPQVGVLGLKRTDVMQSPFNENPQFRSRLEMVPHERGESWKIVEITDDIIGSCILVNSDLIDRVGFFKQPGPYGWEDCDYCVRSKMSGFVNAFLPHIPIVHLDAGETDYTKWKLRMAEDAGEEFQYNIRGYQSGQISLYYEG